MNVEMTVAAGPLRRRFSTIAMLDRPHRIDIISRDPMFDLFEQHWIFQPMAEGDTNVEYRVDFKFRSRVLQVLMTAAYASQAAATMSAFIRRAHRIYGAPS
jgi:coenzyme Q-binding protein COQ10